MNDRLAESDWKTFRKVRERVLDRFCKAVLEDVESICADESKTAHERYGTLYGYIEDRNRQMAAAFDFYSRSSAVHCLYIFQEMGLLTARIDKLGEPQFKISRSRHVVLGMPGPYQACHAMGADGIVLLRPFGVGSQRS